MTTINTEYNGKNVTITLTKEQIKEIEKQTRKQYTVNDITSLEIAEEILKDCSEHTQFFEKQFVRKKDWVSYQLETIIKAANFIDNGFKEWEPNLHNENKYFLHLYFSSGSSSTGRVSVWCDALGSPVDFYFKKLQTAQIIFNNNIELFKNYFGYKGETKNI